MKKIIYAFAFFAAACIFACHPDKEKANNESAEAGLDSVALTEDTIRDFKTFVTDNNGQYAKAIGLFEDSLIYLRVKALAGNLYDSIVANYQTESPIVSEEGVYKFSGGKAHDVPAFQTTFYYDSKDDNLNILVSQNGKETLLKEKKEIPVTETLKSK